MQYGDGAGWSHTAIHVGLPVSGLSLVALLKTSTVSFYIKDSGGRAGFAETPF